VDNIINLLDETFNKSVIDDLRSYLKNNNKIRKFMIFSDYCLHDKAKPNNVASFTIVPYDEFLDIITKKISAIAPNDIKSKKTVEPGFIEYMKEERLFHVSFIIGCTKGLTQHGDKKQRENVEDSIEATIDLVRLWIENTPSNKIYYENFIKKLKNLKQKLDKKSANYRLFRDVMLISLLAGYLAYLLSQEAKAEIIGWFSDRDKIIDSYQSVALDLFVINHHSICNKHEIESDDTKMAVGKVSENIDGGLWYDAQNRLPDHIAGTLADWDMNNNLASKSKFVQVMRKLIANNSNCIVIKLNIGVEEYSCSRLLISVVNEDNDE